MPRTSPIAVCCLIASLTLVGCAPKEEQTRFRVQGTVTYDGQPVPYGEVLFTPDGSKNNSGAQGIADIKNGTFDTQGSRAPGTAGGPMLVRVTALSDPSGKLLIEYDTTLELPKEDTKITIDIPKGGNGKSKPADQTKPEI